MTRPSVSVIVPVYNGSADIAHALESVFAQDQLPDEIVAIDDGSTDDSLAVLKSIQSPVPLIVESQHNQGQSAARNRAASIASGQLLAFIDQDDLWHPRHLARLTRPFVDEPELGWTYSDFDEIDGRGRIVTRGFIRANNLEHPKRSLSQYLSSDLMMLPSAAVIRASAFQSVDGFDVRLCGYEDDDLFIRLFRAGWHSEFVKQPLAKFRVHPTSASASSRFRQSRVIFLDNLVEQTPNDIRLNRYYIRDLVVPRLFRTTLDEYVTALRSGDLVEARRIAGTAAEVNRRSPGGWRRRLAIEVMQRPPLAKRTARAFGLLPTWIRPRLRSAASTATSARSVWGP